MRFYKAVVGGGIDSLNMQRANTPRPCRGQVLVRMRAASLNYLDLMVITGRYSLSASSSDLVPLSDGAGEVVEVGSGVTRVKPGDRVAGIFMQEWIRGGIRESYFASALGSVTDGVLTEYRLFDQRGLVHLPAHLSFEEGATLPCAAVTAWSALCDGCKLRRDQTVLILGTGGVACFALQFAHAMGARTIISSSSDAKLARAKELGATHGVNYARHPDWETRVLELTDGKGVDHVVEIGGPGTLQRSLHSTRIGGSVHLIGVLTSGEINPLAIMRRSLTVRGIYVGSRTMFEAMNRKIASDKLIPVVDQVFSFGDVQQAYRQFECRSHIGKIVVRID